MGSVGWVKGDPPRSRRLDVGGDVVSSRDESDHPFVDQVLSGPHFG